MRHLALTYLLLSLATNAQSSDPTASAALPTPPPEDLPFSGNPTPAYSGGCLPSCWPYCPPDVPCQPTSRSAPSTPSNASPVEETDPVASDGGDAPVSNGGVSSSGNGNGIVSAVAPTAAPSSASQDMPNASTTSAASTGSTLAGGFPAGPTVSGSVFPNAASLASAASALESGMPLGGAGSGIGAGRSGGLNGSVAGSAGSGAVCGGFGRGWGVVAGVVVWVGVACISY